MPAPVISKNDSLMGALTLRHEFNSDIQWLNKAYYSRVNLVSRYCSQLIAINGGRAPSQGSTRERLNTDLVRELFDIKANKIPFSLGYDLVEPVSVSS